MGEIIVKISKLTGLPTVEGAGYRGGECRTDIDAILSALNLVPTSRRGKPERVQRVSQQRVGR